MLRAFRPLAACLAAVILALPAVADARAVTATFEMRFTVLASCSVQVAHGARVDVDCASPATPYLVDGAMPAAAIANPDARRVTVYF